MPLIAEVEQTYRTRELIEELLADPRQLGPDYQPIMRLSDGAVIGYKATGRGAPGTPVADTLSLLDGARSLGLVERLDWAFRSLAFEDMADRPGLELHLTPEPEAFGTPCPPRFAGAFGRARRMLSVCAEVHSDAFAPGVALDRGLAEARDWGWNIVLADVADEPAALDRVQSLRPHVVQIDLTMPGRLPDSGHPGVARLLSIASACGADIMALGVDAPSARHTAAELGATLARGADVGRPGPLPSR